MSEFGKGKGKGDGKGKGWPGGKGGRGGLGEFGRDDSYGSYQHDQHDYGRRYDFGRDDRYRNDRSANFMDGDHWIGKGKGCVHCGSVSFGIFKNLC